MTTTHDGIFNGRVTEFTAIGVQVEDERRPYRPTTWVRKGDVQEALTSRETLVEATDVIFSRADGMLSRRESKIVAAGVLAVLAGGKPDE